MDLELEISCSIYNGVLTLNFDFVQLNKNFNEVSSNKGFLQMFDL